MKYFLLVALWVTTEQGLEEQHGWAMDTGMTYQECVTLLQQSKPYIEMMGGELSCEKDHYGG